MFKRQWNHSLMLRFGASRGMGEIHSSSWVLRGCSFQCNVALLDIYLIPVAAQAAVMMYLSLPAHPSQSQKYISLSLLLSSRHYLKQAPPIRKKSHAWQSLSEKWKGGRFSPRSARDRLRAHVRQEERCPDERPGHAWNPPSVWFLMHLWKRVQRGGLPHWQVQ